MISPVMLLLAGLVQADTEPYQRFAAAYATLDAQRVGQLYAEDAIYLPPAGDIVRGRVEIEERFAQRFRQARRHGQTCRITFELLDRTEAGDIRNDIGYYTIVTTDRDGHAERFRGKFLKVWRRGADGVWRIKSDSYSPSR